MARALMARVRMARARFLAVAILFGLAALSAAPCALRASPDVEPAGAAGPAARPDAFRIDAGALPDTLRDVLANGTGVETGGFAGLLADSTRLWSGAALEAAAIRLRDHLAVRGDVAATIRLVLARGTGSAPGQARFEIVPIRGVSGSSAAAPIASLQSPVLRANGPLAPSLADSAAAAYRAASRDRTSTDGIAAGLSAARDVLIDAGFYAAEVALDSIEVRSTGSAGESGSRPVVHLHVAAGPPATFESMELSGAVATRPRTAARAAGLTAGMRLTPASLAEARDRLAASGLFEQVGDPLLKPGAAAGGVRVVVPVVEERSSRFEGALGVAREGGVTGLVDLALGNIAGSGRSAGLRWFGAGYGRSEYGARYREPALFGTKADAALGLEAQVADSLFTQTRWTAEIGFAPSGTSRASLALQKGGTTYSGLARGSSSSWSLTGTARLDRLRPLLNPSRGFRASVSAEAGTRSDRVPSAPAERRGVFRGVASAEGVLALAPKRVLSVSARGAGTILTDGRAASDPSAPSRSYPAEDLYFLGGSEGLRGHRDRAYAGSRIATFSLEHRWITDERGGRLYLFADAARHDLSDPLAAGTASLAAGTASLAWSSAASGADPASQAAGVSAPSLARTVLSPGWEFGYGAGLRTRVASGLVGLELGFAPGEPLRRATIHVRYASTW